MVTLKKVLDKLNFELDLPEVQYDYPTLGHYESYEITFINGEKCVELKGKGRYDFPLICIIYLDKKMICEYFIHEEGDPTLLRSMDKEGVMPFH